MRVLRPSFLALAVLGFAPVLANAQYSPADILRSFAPSIPGVEYDSPADEAAVKACKVEEVLSDKKKTIGYAVRDGQGKLLRKFVDSNGKRDAKGETHLDQWSYFKDGFEVYRDVDTDEDGKANEAHWLNSGGTRVAIVDTTAGRKGYHVVSWKRISAEEASKVLVQAMLTGDLDLLATVIATSDELKSVGIPAPVADKVTKGNASLKTQYDALFSGKKLKGWDRTTVWSRFDGAIPHVIPADAALGLNKEVVLYENPVVFVQPANPEKAVAGLAYLQATDVIKFGEVWKFADFPQVVDPTGQPPSLEGGLRTALVESGGSVGSGDVEPALQKALKALADYDQEHTPKLDATKKEIAEYHHGRIALLRDVVSAAKKPEVRLTHNKEIVNSLAEAYRMGYFAEGPGLMAKMATAEGGELASYAAFRKIMVVFVYESEQPGADYFALQKQVMSELEKFKSDYPRSAEVAEALLQQGMMSESNNADDDARKYYGELVKKHSDAEPGKWAKGALKRLDLVGASLDLSGVSDTGKRIGTSAYKGKTLLVLFWSTQADVFRRDLPELNRIYSKYQPKGFEILGVNLDTDKDALAAFVKDNPVPGSQIWEPEGMSGRLALEYGLLGQPTMFLVDSTGKVVSRSVKSIAELEKHLDKLIGGGASVSLGATRR
jgi:hypothetical protein